MLTMTPLGPCQYVKMLLGLKDSGAVFQCMIWETLQDCPGSIPYIDDILVYGWTQKEHDQNLEWVLRTLHAKHFHLQLAKCRFRQKSVPFLGHMLSGAKLKPSPTTVAAILDAPVPQSAQQLSSFMGLVNFYNDFVPDLATKAEPLRALGHGSNTFLWSDECQQAFDMVKRAIRTEMTLVLYDPNAPTFLTTDASGVGISAVLSLLQKGREVTVACASHTLQPAERNYSTVEQEALACVWGAEKFEQFLWG